jgi:hypothetical protein
MLKSRFNLFIDSVDLNVRFAHVEHVAHASSSTTKPRPFVLSSIASSFDSSFWMFGSIKFEKEKEERSAN